MRRVNKYTIATIAILGIALLGTTSFAMDPPKGPARTNLLRPIFKGPMNRIGVPLKIQNQALKALHRMTKGTGGTDDNGVFTWAGTFKSGRGGKFMVDPAQKQLIYGTMHPVNQESHAFWAVTRLKGPGPIRWDVAGSINGNEFRKIVDKNGNPAKTNKPLIEM